MHMACGREMETTTGCVRRGVRVWHVLELILFELLDSSGARLPDPVTGFNLLKP
jgi:predicted DNA-binding protein with PD1-like motif